MHFITGQLHNAQGQKQSAMQAFHRVIELKRNVPRAYRVNAFLEQIKNFDYKTGDQVYLSEFLESLVLDRENRPYLDRVYHVIANHHLVLEQDSAAIAYFNKSLRTKSIDNYLNAINYHSIADLYFDDSNYVQAGSYYDSTLVNYTKNTKPYRAVKKRLDNLEDLIRYEAIAQTNDSILKLVAMPEQVLEDYFKKYISSIKAKAKIENKITKQRYKGLGEMNPEQLWDTTMDPETRILTQVEINDEEETKSIFVTLMGEEVGPRKEFIQKNALNVANLDV